MFNNYLNLPGREYLLSRQMIAVTFLLYLAGRVFLKAGIAAGRSQSFSLTEHNLGGTNHRRAEIIRRLSAGRTDKDSFISWERACRRNISQT
jgi:hypothetical protein